MKLTTDQDNIDGFKRRSITLAFIEQERNAIDDLDKVLRGSLFPIEDYLPGSLNVKGFQADDAALAHIDLTASLEKVRDTVVLALVLNNVEGRVERYEKDDAYIGEESPHSETAALVTSGYYARLAGYLADKGLPCDLDAILQVCEDEKRLGDVVSEGVFNDIAEQLLHDYKPACGIYLKQNWPDVTVYRGSGEDTKIADLYPATVYMDALVQGAAKMLDDICSAVLAMREWGNAETALLQRRAWRDEFKAGRSAQYDYAHDYLTPTAPRP